jgi:hypothetical protein
MQLLNSSVSVSIRYWCRHLCLYFLPHFDLRETRCLANLTYCEPFSLLYPFDSASERTSVTSTRVHVFGTKLARAQNGPTCRVVPITRRRSGLVSHLWKSSIACSINLRGRASPYRTTLFLKKFP